MATMLDTRGLSREVVALLRPQGSSMAHDFRANKLMALVTPGVEKFPEFFSRDAIFNTFIGTQFDGENHRRLTPYLQVELMLNRQRFMQNIDQRCYSSVIPNSYNVAVIGTGPHGVAVVANLREKFPTLSTVLIEANPQIGGQFRNYGPKPSFMMNSRVRQADRRLAALPRTNGSINPLGAYAPLELSDISVGNYAMNTDIGDICAINGYLSATQVFVNCTVTAIKTRPGGLGKVLTVVDQSERSNEVYAAIVVLATGIGQRSTLVADSSSAMTSFETAKQSPNFFTTETFYRHFGTHPMPLAMFANQRIGILGAGDSALTCLEALIGALPSQSYGALGIGRHRPQFIDWIGAPRDSAAGLARCLRNRYKNGIPQATDNLRYGGRRKNTIRPLTKTRARSVDLSGNGLVVEMKAGPKRSSYSFPAEYDIVIDCTNQPIPDPMLSPEWYPDFLVGPAAKNPLSQQVQRKVDELKIKENIASLWATMDTTNDISMTIGEMLKNSKS